MAAAAAAMGLALGGCDSLSNLGINFGSSSDQAAQTGDSGASATPAQGGGDAAAPAPKPAPDTALAKYDDAVAQRAGDLAEAYAERAEARRQKGDMDGMSADIERFLALEPDSAVACLIRGQLRTVKGDLPGAIADYSHAIDVQSGTGNRQTAALDSLRRTLAGLFPGMISGDLATAYYLRGAARQASGDPAGAVKDFDQAIDLAPGFAAAYNNRGMLRGIFRDQDGALSDFNRAISLDGESADAYANRGNLRTAQNDLTGAMKDLNRAISINPKWASAWFDRAFVKQRQGDLDGAIEDLGHAVELKPDYGDAYFNRAVDFERKGDFASAVADYDKVVGFSPVSADAYANRGMDKYRLNDIDGSIADFNKAIALKRDMVKAYMDRAVAEKMKGDLDGAVADYGKVAEMSDRDNGMYPRLFRALFMIESGHGDPRKDLADAIAGWPEGWPKELGRFLTGDLSEADLFAKAGDPDPKVAAGQRCEAFYFAGVARLAGGEPALAESLFKQSVDTGSTGRFAIRFAQSELARGKGGR